MPPDFAELRINGKTLVVHPMGAAYWPERSVLIVADLHFEKGSSFARRGVLLPPYDTRTTLKRLAVLARLFDPSEIVSLGDAFHDGEAEARMDETDAALLETLVARHRWTWVLGNHDPEPPARFAGEVVTEKPIGALILRHEPKEGPAPGELAGHLHPCAKIRTDGRLQRRRCFATDGARLVMPAFGAYTGGLNILDTAFAALFEAPTAWALGARAVYPIAPRLLVPDETVADPRRAAG